MFIKLFVKTTDHEKAMETVKSVISNVPEELVKYMVVNAKPNIKVNDVMVAEVELRLTNDFNDKLRNEFLYSISNNWEFSGINKSEALSSLAMPDCNIKYDNLEMINIEFTNQ